MKGMVSPAFGMGILPRRIWAWQKRNPLSGVYKKERIFLSWLRNAWLRDEKADEIVGTIRGMRINRQTDEIRHSIQDITFWGMFLWTTWICHRGNAKWYLPLRPSKIFQPQKNILWRPAWCQPEHHFIIIPQHKQTIKHSHAAPETVRMCACWRTQFRISLTREVLSAVEFYQVTLRRRSFSNKALQLAGLTRKRRL